MKMFRLAAIAACLVAMPLAAQQATLTQLPKVLDANGNVQPTTGTVCIMVDGAACGGTGATASQVQGTGPNGSPVVGNPQLVAGSDGLNARTIATGTGGALQIGTAGSSLAAFVGTNTAATAPTSRVTLGVQGFGYVFDGAQFVRAPGDTSGSYIIQTPTAGAANSITPVVGSLVSSIVGKAAPGNLYSVSITTGAAAAYLYVFNATTPPADGAVVAGSASGQYQLCSTVAATTTLTSSFEIPDRYSVGIVPVVSSTACGTLSKVATATFLKARVQ